MGLNFSLQKFVSRLREVAMKLTGKIQTEAVTDVVCDVCLLTTKVKSGGFSVWHAASTPGLRYEA
jgi:hypothetical protein